MKAANIYFKDGSSREVLEVIANSPSLAIDWPDKQKHKIIDILERKLHRNKNYNSEKGYTLPEVHKNCRKITPNYDYY